MSNVKAFIVLEWKRFRSRRNLVVCAIFFLVLLFLVNAGIDRYNQSFSRVEKFQEIEKRNFQKFNYYLYYSNQGIAILYESYKTGIFFQDSGIASDLVGRLNSASLLGVSDNYKDNSLLSSNFREWWNVSGMFLLFGSLLALLWGYETLVDKGYLKFLASLLSSRRVFLYLIVSRFIMFAFGLLLLVSGLMLTVLVRGISFNGSDIMSLAGFLVVLLLAMAFFFLLGVLTGIIQGKKHGLIPVMVIWFTLIFILPGFVGTVIKNGSVDSTEDYRCEIEKFDVINDFEKRFVEQAGKENIGNIDMKKKFMETYWNKDYKEIERLEEQLKQKIVANIDRYRTVSTFIPTLFYQQSGSEAGSNGHESFFEFYTYLQGLKRKLLRFYLDRIYYHDPRVIVSFIQGDENIFHAKGRLPKNFGLGLVITLVYICLLTIAGAAAFNRFIYTPSIKKPGKSENRNLITIKGDILAINLFKGHHAFNDHLYNLLSGKVDKYNKTINFEVEKEDIRDNPVKHDFIYLCHPGKIPADIRAGHYLDFVARLLGLDRDLRAGIMNTLPVNMAGKPMEKLEINELGEVFLAIFPYFKNQVILVDDAVQDMGLRYICRMNDVMIGLAESGAVVIYMVYDDMSQMRDLNDQELIEQAGPADMDMDIIDRWSRVITKTKGFLSQVKPQKTS